ncbi:MAG: membrane protein insertase YidC [Elusimicrobiota bacterium]
MQKNLIIALVLSSLIYIIWFTWVIPPKKTANLQNPEQYNTKNIQNITEKAKEAKKIELIETPKEAKRSNVIYEIKNEKARYLLNSDLSINSVIYSGPIQDIDLIMDKNYPFLSAFGNFDYKKISQTSDSITVLAKKEIEVTKTLSTSQNNLMNSLIIEFKNPGKKPYSIPQTEISLGPGLNTVKSEEKENPELWKSIYSYNREGRKNPVIEKISSDYNKSDWLWTAIDNRYFLFAVMNNGEFEGLKYFETNIDGHKAPGVKIITKQFILEPQTTKKIEIKFYSGPKDYSLLKTLGNGLHLSVDFGFFAPFAKIANSLLKYFYKHTQNYGVAIILLSALIQIVMYPLSMKSYKAMGIMKKMQPEMKSIQERYKKDPQRMNAELMQLYKKYGANPFSGCWPMLIQIPIFFALFTTLRNSWDLHGAKFIFWIKDLSDKDPYYVLPLLMGGLMFAQNYITPQPVADNAQASVMKWMPIIFTFLFLTFPSGLVLYWIINSVFSIIQNYYLKKSQAI